MNFTRTELLTSRRIDQRTKYWKIREITLVVGLYAGLPSTKVPLHAKCDDSVCAVAGIFDYHVSSPERGKEAIGTSNFTYVLDFRDGIRIVMEDSEVVNR